MYFCIRCVYIYIIYLQAPFPFTSVERGNNACALTILVYRKRWVSVGLFTEKPRVVVALHCFAQVMGDTCTNSKSYIYIYICIFICLHRCVYTYTYMYMYMYIRYVYTNKDEYLSIFRAYHSCYVYVCHLLGSC